MSAFVRTHLSSVWTTGNYAPTPADLADLDSKAFRAVNGVEGGAYAPITPITIVSTLGAGEVHIDGPLVLYGEGHLKTTSGARITPTGGFPKLGATHKGRTRVIANALSAARPTIDIALRFRTAENAMQAVANKVRRPNGSVEVTRWHAVLRVHNGATLTGVTLTYEQVAGAPTVRVVRADTGGNVTPLTSSSLGADADGFVKAPSLSKTVGVPVRGALTVPVDGGASPANAIVDTSAFVYLLEVIEDATQSGFPYEIQQKTDVRVATTVQTPLGGLITVDGVLLADGDRVLAWRQDKASENGIYLAASGAWSRAYDAAFSASAWNFQRSHPPLPFGAVVRVTSGDTYASALFQMQSSVIVIGQDPIVFVTLPPAGLEGAAGYFNAQGNVYLGALVAHAGIADTRFQL